MKAITVKNKVGQPLKFKTPEELERKINNYFDKCDKRKKEIINKKGELVYISSPEPYTMSGLAYSLGVDRETILNYAKREEYFGTIKLARAKVHCDVERRLMEFNSTGAIFNLKNNFGWKDKTEQNLNVKIEKPIMEV